MAEAFVRVIAEDDLYGYFSKNGRCLVMEHNSAGVQDLKWMGLAIPVKNNALGEPANAPLLLRHLVSILTFINLEKDISFKGGREDEVRHLVYSLTLPVGFVEQFSNNERDPYEEQPPPGPPPTVGKALALIPALQRVSTRIVRAKSSALTIGGIDEIDEIDFREERRRKSAQDYLRVRMAAGEMTIPTNVKRIIENYGGVRFSG
jgi:hypothetical protein